MNIELSRHLLSNQGNAKISAESLELMGKEAANHFLDRGIPLNESIAKLAGAHTDFNAEHIKRVVEYANTSVYLAIHDKNKTAGAASSYPQFDLADSSRIIQDLSDGAKPTIVTKTDVDYGTQPSRKQKLSGADADAILDAAFATSSNELPYSRDSVLNTLMSTKYDLEAMKDSLCTSLESLSNFSKEASEGYYSAVKEHILNGGDFSEVYAVSNSVSDRTEKVKEAAQTVVGRLIKEKVASVESLKVSQDKLQKVAHRVVNGEHPVFVSLGALLSYNEELEKVAVAIDSVDAELKRVTSFIKENFNAR